MRSVRLTYISYRTRHKARRQHTPPNHNPPTAVNQGPAAIITALRHPRITAAQDSKATTAVLHKVSMVSSQATDLKDHTSNNQCTTGHKAVRIKPADLRDAAVALRAV